SSSIAQSSSSSLILHPPAKDREHSGPTSPTLRFPPPLPRHIIRSCSSPRSARRTVPQSLRTESPPTSLCMGRHSAAGIGSSPRLLAGVPDLQHRRNHLV